MFLDACEAIKFDDKNVKGYYRRGQAQAALNQMHDWSLSDALEIRMYEATRGYAKRKVDVAVIWAGYEGYA